MVQTRSAVALLCVAVTAGCRGIVADPRSGDSAGGAEGQPGEDAPLLDETRPQATSCDAFDASDPQVYGIGRPAPDEAILSGRVIDVALS